MKALKKRGFPILLMFALLPLTGCATLIRGNTQEVSVSSQPSEAEVYVNGLARGKTPVMLRLDRDMSYHVELRHPDFGSSVFMVNRQLGTGWLVLDILCGLVPVVVDASSGAWYSLEPDNVVVQLSESTQMTSWKMELLRAMSDLQERKGHPSPGQKKFSDMLKQLGITPEEWVASLDEADYKNFQESGKNPKDWLQDRIEAAVYEDKH